MICFFVKTKATDDTRSIPSAFYSPLSLSLSAFRPVSIFLFLLFSLFFLSPRKGASRAQSRWRVHRGGVWFRASETSRWEIIRCRSSGGRVGTRGERRVKSESPSIPF